MLSTQPQRSTRMPTWSAPKNLVPHISYVSPKSSSCSNRVSVLCDSCFEVPDIPARVHQGPQNIPCTPSRSSRQPDKKHAAMHFSTFYDDDCYIHRSAKESCSGRRPRRDSSLTWRGRFSLRESHDLPYPLRRFTTIATSKVYQRPTILGRVWLL